jgi:hypothetical protein
LRALDEEWYLTLPLPDLDFISYRVPCVYGALSPNKRKISLVCSLLQRKMTVDNAFIAMYGTSPPGEYTLLTAEHLVQYPILRTVVAPVLPTVEDFQFVNSAKRTTPQAQSDSESNGTLINAGNPSLTLSLLGFRSCLIVLYKQHFFFVMFLDYDEDYVSSRDLCYAAFAETDVSAKATLARPASPAARVCGGVEHPRTLLQTA